MEKVYTAKDLIYWSTKNIKDELLFDKILDIHDDILEFLNSKSLEFDGDKELFLMKLLLFIKDNSEY
jgi:hypothetical protein